MIPAYTCELVPVSSFKFDLSWDIQPFLPLDQPVLQSSDSIRTIGLIRPPLVLQSASDTFTVISCLRSLSVHISAHRSKEVFCRVLHSDTPPNEILKLLYSEYSEGRSISLIELSHFIKLCFTTLSSEEERTVLLGDLSIDSRPHFIRRVLSLLDLSYDAQTMLMDGNINENVARELLSLGDIDRDLVVHYFRELQMGGGKQKRMLTLARDVSRRQNRGISELFNDCEITEILQHKEMNPPQKVQCLLQLLQRLHTPTLHAAEKDFREWETGLSLPENCYIEHSQAFEKDEIKLTVHLKDKRSLEHKLSALKAILED